MEVVVYTFVEDSILAGMRRIGGHYCGTWRGKYKMVSSWIDTDNKVWSEPYHLYTYDVDGLQYDMHHAPSFSQFPLDTPHKPAL